MIADVVGAVIRRAMSERFRLSHADCGTFAADMVLALTGVDPAAELRGAYDSAEARDRLIGRRWGSWRHMLDALLAPAGYRRVRVAEAGMGAIALAAGPDGRGAICICSGNGFWVTKSERGVVFLRAADMRLAWGQSGGS